MPDLMRQCQPGGGARLQRLPVASLYASAPRFGLVEPQPDLLVRKLTGLVSGKG